MKLLLTSSGITNESITKALVDLLGKPISESSALFVPKAIYPFPGGPNYSWVGIKESGKLGWKEFGVLELTALPSMPKECWLPQFEATDALIVGGGNGFYLSYWMEQSGLFELIPRFLARGKVYVGISAGSMIMTAKLHFNQEHFDKTDIYLDDEYNEEMPSSAGSAKTLKLVDFVIRPHLESDYFPQVTLDNAERGSKKAGVTLYALDDQSTIRVSAGKIEVVSEGEWKRFEKDL
jgi:dipeptidase E